MRPKNYIEDITTLTNTLTQSMTYYQDMEEQLEYFDEYVEFISEFLTEFRNDRVYVTEQPVTIIPHPEGLRRLIVDLDPNLVGTPTTRTVSSENRYMYSLSLIHICR